MTDYQNWVLEIDQPIATLTLNRAEQMNSLTSETLHELRDIAHVLRDNREVWVIILQSAGEHFSVGVDVNQIQVMVGQDEAVYRENLRDMQDCLDTFEALPQPIIAKIKGYCIGGGLILACCCDFRVADETAMFHLPEVQLGIAVIMGTQRLTRIAGIPNTKEMVMLAERFDAEKAHTYGLLHNLVDPEELDEVAEDLAIRFSKLPPRTVSIAKQIIDQGATMPLRESQDLEMTLQAGLLNSPDFKEGVDAFFEKRSAQFTGE
jgi:enoyl-CoA hydratase/carnithine racemase